MFEKPKKKRRDWNKLSDSDWTIVFGMFPRRNFFLLFNMLGSSWIRVRGGEKFRLGFFNNIEEAYTAAQTWTFPTSGENNEDSSR